MFGNKIKVSSELYKKMKEAAKVLGAVSIDEFAEQILERESERIINEASKSKADLSAKEVENIANKLKGLGYLE